MENKEKKITSSFFIPGLILLSFILWVFNFRGFLFGKLAFTSDAISYYEHIKFFIKSLAQGVYPLWDPFWNSGVPNEFFLRRIGSFNPFYGIILFFYKIGVSFSAAYMSFLAIYYFIGMIGFYKLAKRIFHDQTTAFFAYLMLLMSSLGTRLFDSYILLFTIPIIWFFYYFLSFVQQPKKHYLLGLVFTLMIIFTTYIPFYFMNIFLTFLFCSVLFYARNLFSVIQRVANFLSSNKIFVILCLLLFLFSLIPGLKLMREGKKKDFVLPHRSYTADGKNTIQVGYETITSWGILEDLVYSDVYSRDLSRFKFAVVYVPIFAFLALFFGFLNSVSKRALFFLSWMLLLFLMHSPYFPFYRILYEKVFYYKFFRNLHFYLWAGLIPIFILLAAEQFHLLFLKVSERKSAKVTLSMGIIVLHVLALGLLIRTGSPLMTSLLTVVGSGLIFLGYYYRKLDPRLFLILLLLLGSLQPLSVYTYLQKNYSDEWIDYGYDRLGSDYIYNSPTKKIDEAKMPQNRKERLQYKENRLYYSTARFNSLDQNVYYRILKRYLANKFYLYDRIEVIDEKNIDFVSLENNFLEFVNQAYITKDSSFNKGKILSLKEEQERVIPLQKKSSSFEVVAFNANKIKFKTNFLENKFLVFNDCYHKAWKAFLNEKEIPIYKSNIAFKGIFLPKGENNVEFRFDPGAGVKTLNLSLVIIFMCVFVSLLYYESKEMRA